MGKISPCLILFIVNQVWQLLPHYDLAIYSFSFSEEAKRKYGEENIKIYESLFVNLYFALSETKQKTHMKLVCLKPQEKVLFVYFRNCFVFTCFVNNFHCMLTFVVTILP